MATKAPVTGTPKRGDMMGKLRPRKAKELRQKLEKCGLAPMPSSQENANSVLPEGPGQSTAFVIIIILTVMASTAALSDLV